MPLFGATVEVARFKDETDLVAALKCCEDLRVRERIGDRVSHVVMTGKPADMVGELGVAAPAADYDWRKRR